MLYFVPTPIGNLEDITLRALRILKEADYIYAEDTRHTIKLLNHYEIKSHLVSYHEHNERNRLEEIVHRLSEGKNIAIVSDAGIPGISDPGFILAEHLAELELDFTVLPGSNAALAALLLSGLDTSRFFFQGFLPRDKKSQKDLLQELSSISATILIYESPNRIRQTLKSLIEAFGDRKAALCREISKIHETAYRGMLSDLDELLPEDIRGECVIVVSGADDQEFVFDLDSTLDKMESLVMSGMRAKDAAKMLASFEYSASELYSRYIKDDR